MHFSRKIASGCNNLPNKVQYSVFLQKYRLAVVALFPGFPDTLIRHHFGGMA